MSKIDKTLWIKTKDWDKFGRVLVQDTDSTFGTVFYEDGGVHMNIKVKLDNGAYPPERAHAADAGMDLKTPVSVGIAPKEWATIDTGVHVEIPYGYVGFLKSKSGLNVKHGLVSEGVIDSGYTGSITVKLYNHSDSFFYFFPGDKITQLVILPCVLADFEIVNELEETERGDNGFGSTGR